MPVSEVSTDLTVQLCNMCLAFYYTKYYNMEIFLKIIYILY